MKTVFVYNPKSGSALSRRSLTSTLARHNISIDIWLPINTSFDSEMKKIIKTKSLIYAYGGDGTVSAVAGHLAGTTSTLVPLPGGTLNHFTKDLGIEQDLDSVLEQLSSKYTDATIDIASVNGRYFINNSSIGLYAQSLKTREKLENHVSKWPAATLAANRALVRFRWYHVTIDGKNKRTAFVYVGNNTYSFEGGDIASRRRLDEGHIMVMSMHTTSRRKALWLTARLVFGREPKHEAIDILRSTESTIKMRRPKVLVSRDGEIERLPTPLAYKIHAGALRVRLPQANAKS